MIGSIPDSAFDAPQLGTLLEDACPVCSRALEGDVVRCESCYQRTGEGFVCRSCGVPFGGDDRLVKDPADASYWLCTVDYLWEKNQQVLVERSAGNAAGADVSGAVSKAPLRRIKVREVSISGNGDRQRADASIQQSRSVVASAGNDSVAIHGAARETRHSPTSLRNVTAHHIAQAIVAAEMERDLRGGRV